MFTEDDVRDAKQVEPLDLEDEFVTKVMSKNNLPVLRLTPVAPAVVIFSLILLTAPKGAVLENAISAFNSAKQLWSHQTQSSDSHAIKQGDTSINANNSNVQNVQVINNNGQISISAKK